MKKMLLNELKIKLIMLKNKGCSIEKIYYPHIINNICYLYGASIIYDDESKKTYFIRNVLFGYDSEETRLKAMQEGYIFVNDSSIIKDNLEALDHSHYKIKNKKRSSN